MKRVTGKYEKNTVGGEDIRSYIPYPLPPAHPKLQLDTNITQLLQNATQAVASLGLAAAIIPSQNWFIYSFVRKEAVTSSQIEGTQATLMDLLDFEAETTKLSQPNADLEEICNYLSALNFAREELQKKKGLPLSMRLLNEAHHRLMKGVRGANKQPGEIRQSQNWIGGIRPGQARFVPPPPHSLPRLLSDLEKYFHIEDNLPKLIRIGLIHVQFETIHPYLDGNGRIGRLLINLLFEHWGLLQAPLLYLSLYFKRHRSEYYDRLSAVRYEGDWEGWTRFFLEGIQTIAEEAISLAQALFSMVEKDRQKLITSSEATVMGVRLFEMLPLHPIVTMSKVVELLETTKPTATKAIAILEKLGILAELSGKKRDRRFGYTNYIEKLRIGTELSS